MKDNLTNIYEEKPLFTVKNILKILLLLCIIFVFCPAFLVSCSGQEMNINVMTAVKGISAEGQEVVPSHPSMLICLILPIAMLIILFIKNLLDKQIVLILLAGSIIDFIIWLVFESSAKKIAEEYYCDFEVTIWFILNMIALVLIALLSLAVILNKIQLNIDLKTISSGLNTKNINNGSPNSYPNSHSYNNTYGNNISNNFTRGNYENSVPDQISKTLPSTSRSIQFISGELHGASIPIENRNKIIIGRDPSNANIVLHNQDISRQHCEIQYNSTDGCYYICDYSSYGLSINEQQIPKNKPIPCNIGDKISLANGENQLILK